MKNLILNIVTKLEDDRHKFAIKYGFAYKRAQDFKNCIVIRWKTSPKKYKISHSRIDEYVKIANEISQKYDLYIEEYPLLSFDLLLLNAGIYVFSTFDYKAWAIPNENKEVQEYVLSKLPKWAKLSIKK